MVWYHTWGVHLYDLYFITLKPIWILFYCRNWRTWNLHITISPIRRQCQKKMLPKMLSRTSYHVSHKTSTHCLWWYWSLFLFGIFCNATVCIMFWGKRNNISLIKVEINNMFSSVGKCWFGALHEWIWLYSGKRYKLA